MFTHLLSTLPSSSVITLIETLTSFKLVMKISIQNFDDISSLYSLVDHIPPRDRFEILLEAGDSLFRSSRAAVDSSKLNDFSGDAVDLGEVNVTISITKNRQEEFISVYSARAFENYLTTEDLASILSTMTLVPSDKLRFDYLGIVAGFSTRTISFGQALPDDMNNIRPRESIIADFKEGSSFSGISNFKLLPDDFQLHDSSNSSPIQDFLSYACGLLSLAYIANVSELDRSNNFSFRINGYRAVHGENVDRQYVIRNSKMLYRIYSWIFHASNITDRLGLARNVLSLHLDPAGLPDFNQAAWDAIQSNYKIYLQGNIENYLEVKGKIAELLIDAVAKTNQLSESLLDSLKNNALIILTFLITVVLINGVKDLNIASVFSFAYLIIVIILIVFSAAWLFLLRHDVKDRFTKSSEILGNVVRRNYAAILTNDEIDRSITPVILENKNHLEIQIKKYSYWWTSMLGAFLLLYLLGFFSYAANSAHGDDADKRKEKHSQQGAGKTSNEFSSENLGKRLIGPPS